MREPQNSSKGARKRGGSGQLSKVSARQKFIARAASARAQLVGLEALAAAAPAFFFAPLAVLALTLDGAPHWAMGAAVLGAAPLALLAGVAVTRPIPAKIFGLASAPLAIAAAWFGWASGGALSPAAPWLAAALAAMALFGGRTGALAAAMGTIVLMSGGLAISDAPVRFFGFAPRAEREVTAAISMGAAALSLACCAWAATRAWTAALPPLRHPTIAAQNALKNLSEASATCALRVGEDGLVADTVGAASKVFDFPPGALRGASLESLAHPDDASAVTAMLEAARRGSYEPMTVRLRSLFGGYRWMEVSTGPAQQYPAEDPRSTREADVMLVVRARWRPEHEGEVPEDPERTLFLAQMDTDLRGGLKSIVGFTDILRNELFGPLGAERYREYVRLAHDVGQKLVDKVDALLDLAEIEAGRVAQSPEPVEPAPMIDSALRLTRAQAQARGVIVASQITPMIPQVSADRRGLRRVLVAMISDTLRVGKFGETIEIEATHDPETIRFALKVKPLTASGARAEDDPTDALRVAPEDYTAEFASTDIAETRLSRMVAESLAQRMGGTLIFSFGPDEEAPADGVVAEAIFPIAKAAPALEPATQDPQAAPQEAPTPDEPDEPQASQEAPPEVEVEVEEAPKRPAATISRFRAGAGRWSDAKAIAPLLKAKLPSALNIDAAASSDQPDRDAPLFDYSEAAAPAGAPSPLEDEAAPEAAETQNGPSAAQQEKPQTEEEDLATPPSKPEQSQEEEILAQKEAEFLQFITSAQQSEADEAAAPSEAKQISDTPLAPYAAMLEIDPGATVGPQNIVTESSPDEEPAQSKPRKGGRSTPEEGAA